MRKFRFLLIALGLELFSLAFVFAQDNYQVSTCQQLGLNPGVRGSRGGRIEILAIYLEGNDEGIGGLGCWVHHHPNGRDYVVTPHSWGGATKSG